MLLTVYNGSPRGKQSNTDVLLSHFFKGFTNAGHNSYQLIYLGYYETTDTQLRFFEDADFIIIAFPLYIGCMPAPVKSFFEALQSLPGKTGKNSKLGFLVHSGFPEAAHSRSLERYLEKLTKRLGRRYLGTVISGGSETIQAKPERMSRRARQFFYLLGKHFGETGYLSPEFISELAQPEKLSPFWLKSFTLLSSANLTNYFWDRQLDQNKALEKRFARPYEQ